MAFKDHVEEMMSFIIDQKGEEVISERHQKDFKKTENTDSESTEDKAETSNFTDVNFEDI